MPTHETLEARDGRPARVRHADGASVAELQREAAALHLAAGPGVPEVLAFDHSDSEATLVVAQPPALRPRTWRVEEVAAAGAHLAHTLARAHAQGVVHGALDLEMLLGEPEAPCISRWESARLPGDADGPEEADDVVALGRLLQVLTPSHRPDRELEAVLRRATAPDAASRPTMTAFAASLRSLCRPPAGRRWQPPGRVVAAAAGSLLLVVVGGLLLRLGHRSDEPPPAASAVLAAPGTTSTTAPPPAVLSTPRRLWPAAAISIDGNIVTLDGERWRVGRADDVLAIGDWHCHGAPAVAVLRPATGQIWAFDQWAPADESVAGRPVAQVAGAVLLQVRRVDGCDRLEAVDQDGRTSLIGW